jgi:hypothetical protein
MSDGITPPKSAQQEFVERLKEKCEHTGLTKPECCCYDCMYNMIRRNLPDMRTEAT